MRLIVTVISPSGAMYTGNWAPDLSVVSRAATASYAAKKFTGTTSVRGEI
jgi:hypothetical protein